MFSLYIMRDIVITAGSLMKRLQYSEEMTKPPMKCFVSVDFKKFSQGHK